MTQYNTVSQYKIVWFATQLIKIKNTGSWISGISVIPGIPVNNGTKVTLNLSSNSDSNGETNFPHRLLLTTTRVSRLRKTFANNTLRITGLLIKSVSQIIQNEAKKQEVGFLGMLLGTIGAGLLGNSLGSKRVKAKIPAKEVMRAGEETIAAGEGPIRTSQTV